MLSLINSAQDARDRAVVEATKTKRVSSWKHWNTYLHSIGIKDVFLTGFSQLMQNTIISGFGQAVRQGSFSKGNNKQLVEGTVSTTLSHVAQTFRANDRKDPRLDRDGKTCFQISEQLRGYRNQDSSTKKQKALPLMVLRKMMKLSNTELQKAQTWHFIGAIYFAMRSCEYVRTVLKEDSKRTKIIRLRNIRFKKDGRIVKYDSQNLFEANMVVITFEFQKNNIRNRAVHMFRTEDSILCPVIAWATTVQRILCTVPKASKNSKVSMFY